MTITEDDQHSIIHKLGSGNIAKIERKNLQTYRSDPRITYTFEDELIQWAYHFKLFEIIPNSGCEVFANFKLTEAGEKRFKIAKERVAFGQM